MKKTKIVCTIGPASESERVLKEMFKAGLNVCRLNFSHGTHEEHKIKIDRIKKVREDLGLPIAIMLDTKGPEIRLGNFEKPAEIVQGQEFIITSREVTGTNQICSISYKNLTKDIKLKSRILINDGMLELQVIDILNDTDIECVAVNSGTLTSKKGVNIPGLRVNIPYMSEKDIADIEFAIENDLDFIAASFIQNADDVMQIKNILNKHNSTIAVIAKIENQEGLDNIDSILEVADGIMVARGDLGVEIPPEKIPHEQKKLIRKANLAGKLVITATQMLESMTHNLRPTRAEVTDVANAILDGTSAVMLSGETAAGEYPVETVAMMNSIAVTTEATLDYEKLFLENASLHETTVTNALARATCSTALSLGANVIITASASGITPRALSKFKPKIPIIAITPSVHAMRKLSLEWDVYPVLSPIIHSTDNMFNICSQIAKEAGYVKTGDLAILTAGIPIGQSGSTNLLKVQTIE
ncbi:pyruvate kinase [Treponema pedis]|uniref:Pyruvate kinase n=1 Tax=Treponema pedis TaxID=409322 RepID=A0A7S6WMU0_9SPIR|nr:pyruvate kinase [Treponema pedis]QOW60058.1 pyruvate kinase [Treponema pedis]QSI05399.1 pyruvate kinase [Treponema pedis]